MSVRAVKLANLHFSRRRNATNIEIVKPLHFLRHTDIKYVRQFFTLQIISLQYRAVLRHDKSPSIVHYHVRSRIVSFNGLCRF